MSKINVYFNNKNYLIDKDAFAASLADLKSHLSTKMNGVGATINLDGVPYSIDSAKLASATNDFVTHLGTISGSGQKVKVGEVEYNIDSSKISNAVSALDTVFSGISVTDDEDVNLDNYLKIDGCPIKFGTPYYNDDTSTWLVAYTDGRAEVYVSQWYPDESYPAGSFTYEGCNILVEGQVFATVSEDGQSVEYQGLNFALDTSWCPHGDTYIKGVTDIYTGDECCVYCKEVIIEGECNHIHSEIRDYDTSSPKAYCLDCQDWFAYVVPKGGVYTNLITGDVYNEGDIVPDSKYGKTHDATFVYDGLEYSKNHQSGGFWRVTAIDKNRTAYHILDTPFGIRLYNICFKGCQNIVSAGVIGSGASVEIPNGINVLFYGAFESCTGLTSVELPSNVNEIGSRTFEDCTRLNSIVIPTNVTEIANSAFSGCKNLKTITYKGTVEQWNSIDKTENHNSNYDWNHNSSITEIQCSDGTITL